jgi:hypothetical protein
MGTDSFVSRGGADSESYVARAITKPKGIDPSTSPRALMDDAKVADVAVADETERPAAIPVIPSEVVQENLRRVKAGAANTLIRRTVGAEGTVYHEYHENRVVREGDGRHDTLRADRGRGTTDSLDMLSKEGKVRLDKLLPGQKRDGSGRFTR